MLFKLKCSGPSTLTVVASPTQASCSASLSVLEPSGLRVRTTPRWRVFTLSPQALQTRQATDSITLHIQRKAGMEQGPRH